MSVLKSLLLGGQSYPSAERVLSGLTLDMATRRLSGMPHTIHDLLWHLDVTQTLFLRLVAEEEIEEPSPDDLWPSAAPTDEDWEDLLSRVRAGLYEASEFAGESSLTDRDRDLLADIAAHNAYHWGQVVVMRRVLGDWVTDEFAPAALES